MFCTTCTTEKRPAKGSPVPHYCNACGFPLTETGARIVKPEAAFLVALGDIYGSKTTTAPEAPADAVLEGLRRMARP